MSTFTKLGLGALFLFAASSLYAQVPTHPMYVQKFPKTSTGADKEFVEYFESWNYGEALTEDDNFFISRVKPKKRFTDASTQVNKSLTTDRLVCWWCPLGISDNSWTSLPRNKFDADAFSMWQYIDYHGGWSDSWGRIPGAFADVSHRNGVYNGCILAPGYGEWLYPSTGKGLMLTTLMEKDANGEFTKALKFVRFLKYYGIDGIGFNSECYLQNIYPENIKAFFEKCHELAEQENWRFKVYWYDGERNNGSLGFGSNQLDANNCEWFQRPSSNYPVTDMFMLNYNWFQYQLTNSTNKAVELNRSSYDVFAGFDTQGRWIRNTQYNYPNGGWLDLEKSKISIALWGAHQKNMIYENSNELGQESIVLQTTYQKKQEQFFTGGTRNPGNCPATTNSVTSASMEAMTKFHGISKMVPARSVLSNDALPFVTRFCIGNGENFKVDGNVTFDKEWYNIGVQDILPTWRWWVVDAAGNVPTDAIKCELTFTDAWFGGSSLQLTGATEESNIRLYKTDFDITSGAEVKVTFKLKGGDASHLSLLWSADGSTFKTAEITDAAVNGQWVTATLKANEIGMVGKVKELGLTVKGTTADYNMLIGELSIDNKDKTFNPLTPKITSYKVLAGTFNTVDFKVIFKSKDQDASKPWEPIYNDDVDTWYFEIFTEKEGDSEPTLCTTTSSWAAYVVGAPAEPNVKSRFGVRAVAPDGVTKSDIAWTEYAERQITVTEGIIIDKPIIKPNEEFTIKFLDPTHEQAYSWRLVDSATGVEAKTIYDVTETTMSLPNTGVYDLEVKNTIHATPVYYRAFVQITPESTGALPLIGDLTVDKSTVETGEDVTATVTVSRLGEGKVSRAVSVRDPELLMLPNTVGSGNIWSIAMWVKVDKYAHGRFGTNLINRRSLSNSWPHNNWGTFWVHIWPGGAYEGVNDNVISYTYYGTPDSQIGFNGNKHESPNSKCMANDYSIAPGQWTHVVISENQGRQRLWINGKMVAEYTPTSSYTDNGTNCGTYIGGTNVYHGGLIGAVDDVQYWTAELDAAGVKEAMAGYNGKDIPSALSGYWDFEEIETANGNSVLSSFPNKGKGGADMKASIITFGGTAGETTTGSYVEYQAASNDELGYPGIPGTLDVNTVTKWESTGAPTITPNGANATFNYANDGDQTITVVLENRWGKATRTAAVLVKKASGIGANNVNEMKVFPNPFVETVNVMFADAGNYTIEVVDANGRVVSKSNVNANANEVVGIGVNGVPGMYVVRVLDGTKCLKSMKVIKK